MLVLLAVVDTLGLEAPGSPTELNAAKDRQGKVRRRDLFGGLLHGCGSC
jgi:hypothetical protein